MNNQRKEGESIKQWQTRIKAENRENRVQNRSDYGGELEAAVVTASAQKVPSDSLKAIQKLHRDIESIKGLFGTTSRNSWLQRKFDAPEWLAPMPSNMSSDPTVIDLSSNAYSSRSESDSGQDLFNEYMEVHNPNIHSAEVWKRLPDDYLLKDNYEMPKSNIRLYQGVENGTYKIAPLEHFNDTTTLIPNRTALGQRLVGVSESEEGPVFKFENDSTSTSLPFSGKGTIGNESGGMFINRPTDLNAEQIQQINEFIKQHGPVHQVKQDSGSYGYYETSPGKEYLNQGVGFDKNNVLIFGRK